MAWNTEMVRIVRTLVGDLSSTPTYDDARLEEAILVNAQLVQMDVDFPNSYTVDVDELLLTPDPTDRSGGTRDDSFINLVCLKTACMITLSELRTAAGQSIAIKDGDSSIDLRGTLQGRVEVIKHSWCKEYENAKLEYVAGNRVPGRAIVGPHNIWPGDFYRGRPDRCL